MPVNGVANAALLDQLRVGSTATSRALTRAEVVRLQQALAERGYDTGPADGVIGPKVRGAIRICSRIDHFKNERFALAFDDDGARQGYCLALLGCRGMTTRNACSSLKWNQGTSYPRCIPATAASAARSQTSGTNRTFTGTRALFQIPTASALHPQHR